MTIESKREEMNMNEVTVERGSLLEVVRENREAHKELFEEAVKGYRKKVIDELEMMIEEARKGGRIRRAIQLPEPENHTADYDRVIKMLEMSIHDNVELDAREFNQYVMDDWGWKDAFIATASSYTS